MTKAEGFIMGGVALALAGGMLGAMIGSDYTERKIHGQEKVRDAREASIMGHVIERNPDASIKDFGNFAPALLRISAKHGQDYRLIMALIEKESQFRPKAVGRDGEIGLMQIMPDTARLVAQGTGITYVPPTKKDGKYVTLGSLADPENNLEIGVAFLAERIKKFGDVPTGLQAYNRGDAKAREYRPHDDYAKAIAFNYVALVPRLPEGR